MPVFTVLVSRNACKTLKTRLHEQLISNTIFSQSFASETTSFAVRNKVSLLDYFTGNKVLENRRELDLKWFEKIFELA